MNEQRSFERFVADDLGAIGPMALPEDFYDDIDTYATRHQQPPTWLALIKEPPMRTNAHLAVGSPTVRVAAILAATLLLALTVAGAGIAGARLLAADGAIVVAQDGSGDFTTIGEAVAAAVDDDEILVRPGTYDESIVLDKDVTIRGDGDRDEVVVELSVELPPGGTFNPPGLPTAFLIESADATLENLTVRGESSRIVIIGGAPELRDLVLDGVGRVYLLDPSAPSGLLIDDGSTALIENNMMVDTDIGIRSGSSPTLVGNAITIGAIFMVEEAEPVIRENTIDGSVKWGIAIWEGARPEVVANTILNARTGIDVTDRGTDPIVRGNTISGSTSAGMSVGASASATIEDNELTDNVIGLALDSSDARLDGNVIRGGGAGIVITGGGSPVLTSNSIEGAANRGIVVGRGTSPTLIGNRVCGSGENLVVQEFAEPVMEDNEVCPDTPVEATE